MDKTKLLKLVQEASQERDDGKRSLACARAFDIGKKHNVPVAEIGKLCNEENIKIAQCQLGCFK